MIPIISTMTYNKWDIILVPFPFSDLTSVKKRPALVISPDKFNSGDDLIIAFITSNIPDTLRFGDYKVINWKESGLLIPSILRMKFATITKSIIIKKIGILVDSDCQAFSKELINFFN